MNSLSQIDDTKIIFAVSGFPQLTNFNLILFVTNMPRRQFTIAQKLAILNELDEAVAQGRSIRSVAREHALEPSQLRWWLEKRPQLLVAKNKRMKTLHRGRKSTIKDLEDNLIGWGLDQRQAGFPVRFRSLQLRACQIDANFCALDFRVQYERIRRLCVVNCLVTRRKTSQAQQHPQEMVDQALGWLADVRPLLNLPGTNRQYVLNMDQTAVFFNMAPNTTLKMKGTQTVPVRILRGTTDRVTVSICVSAAGDKLKPMIIFHGKPDGRIVNRDFPLFDHQDNMLLACQEQAWQDGNNMLLWVENVLRPHLQERAQGVPVILFLDGFSAHRAQATVDALTNLGVQVVYIPGGCTGLVQPIDVGVCKPFKDRLRGLWWDWLVSQDPDLRILRKASREDIADWVYQSWEAMPAEIIRNAWRKTDFSFL